MTRCGPERWSCLGFKIESWNLSRELWQICPACADGTLVSICKISKLRDVQIRRSASRDHDSFCRRAIYVTRYVEAECTSADNVQDRSSLLRGMHMQPCPDHLTHEGPCRNGRILSLAPPPSPPSRLRSAPDILGLSPGIEYVASFSTVWMPRAQVDSLLDGPEPADAK